MWMAVRKGGMRWGMRWGSRLRNSRWGIIMKNKWNKMVMGCILMGRREVKMGRINNWVKGRSQYKERKAKKIISMSKESKTTKIYNKMQQLYRKTPIYNTNPQPNHPQTNTPNYPLPNCVKNSSKTLSNLLGNPIPNPSLTPIIWSQNNPLTWNPCMTFRTWDKSNKFNKCNKPYSHPFRLISIYPHSIKNMGTCLGSWRMWRCGGRWVRRKGLILKMGRRIEVSLVREVLPRCRYPLVRGLSLMWGESDCSWLIVVIVEGYL